VAPGSQLQRVEWRPVRNDKELSGARFGVTESCVAPGSHDRELSGACLLSVECRGKLNPGARKKS